MSTRMLRPPEAFDISMNLLQYLRVFTTSPGIVRALSLCATPPDILDLTGSELVSMRTIAEEFGGEFGVVRYSP